MQTLHRNVGGQLLDGSGWAVVVPDSTRDPVTLVAHTSGVPLNRDGLVEITRLIAAYYDRDGVVAGINVFDRPGGWPLDATLSVSPYRIECVVRSEDRHELFTAVAAVVGNPGNRR
jgi:hypothetical protein